MIIGKKTFLVLLALAFTNHCQAMETELESNYFESLPIEIQLEIVNHAIEEIYKNTTTIDDFKDQLIRLYKINKTIYSLTHQQPIAYRIKNLIPQKFVEQDPIAADQKLIQRAALGDQAGVEFLLLGGVNVNAQTNTKCASNKQDQTKLGRRGILPGDTALIQATAQNHPEIVKILLAHGANVNLRNDDRKTPLMEAVFRNFSDITKLLLNNGAYVDRNQNNVALLHGNTELVMLLEEAQKRQNESN